ncbi:unnamed protein product [Orchesella dallaii]|uniref:Uncharacterized protein n=1 Tax=Orchesella dallaii TaxID=48710 RepID=A0ABP1RT29_9HEXA
MKTRAQAHFPISIEMTTLTLTVILFLVMDYPTSGSSSLSTDNDAAASTALLKRRSCVAVEDCRDPNTECLNGSCFCKPYYDDNLETTGYCMKSYGGQCNSSVLCNVNKNLACFQGICSCYDPVGHVYDPYLKTCVVKPKHTCELQSYMDVKAGCVRNANCVPDPRRSVDKRFFGVCECAQGYVPKGEKECVKDIGSECVDDADCDDVVGMKCSNGGCACAENRLWKGVRNECGLKANSDCELDEEDCVENASCVVIDGREEKEEYYSNSKWELKCVCNVGFHEDKNGACVKDSKDGDCGDDGKVFDRKRGRCSTRVGGSCKTVGVNRCVSHAFCGTGNKCQCFEGYWVGDTLACMKISDQHWDVKKSPLPPPPITTASQRREQEEEINGSSCPFLNSQIVLIFQIVLVLLVV